MLPIHASCLILLGRYYLIHFAHGFILPHAFKVKEIQESKGAGKRYTINLNKFGHNLYMKIPNIVGAIVSIDIFCSVTALGLRHLFDKGYKLLLGIWSNGWCF